MIGKLYRFLFFVHEVMLLNLLLKVSLKGNIDYIVPFRDYMLPISYMI